MFPFLCIGAAITELAGESGHTDIGYYTMIKLNEPKSGLYLSSIRTKYVAGSNQYVTRGIKKGTLAETYWTIWPTENQTVNQGDYVQCGQEIRLKNAATGLWLHSHEIPRKEGSGYEVSSFDETDTGNYWIFNCNDFLSTDSVFSIEHVDTGYYLAASPDIKNSVEEGGEYEIYASESVENEWSIAGGIFVGSFE